MRDIRHPLDVRDFATTLRPFEEAEMLASRAYVEPAFYALEVERIFRREWISVGRVEQIPNPGDYFTIDLFGEPLLIVRGDDTRVRALSSVCRHRAMPVVEGTGSLQSFQCPYHLWTYALDGRLIGAPGMERTPGFRREDCRLPQIRTEIWEGWIFINFDSAAPALAPALEPLRRRLEGVRLSEYRMTEPLVYDSPWNWKVFVDNFMESYHHMGIHADTLNPIAPALGTWAEDLSGPYAVLHNPMADGVAAGADTAGDSRYPDEFRASAFMVVCVWPFHLFAFTSDSMQYAQLIPTGPHHMTLKFFQCVPAEERDDPSQVEKIEAGRAFLDAINRQDIVANLGVMKGHHSALARPGRYAFQERALWQFHRWVLSRVFPEGGHA
jgi:phenylpropionate dioxygenase-like ring-hydroxylating dioxygenase large terminal subunit